MSTLRIAPRRAEPILAKAGIDVVKEGADIRRCGIVDRSVDNKECVADHPVAGRGFKKRNGC